ncbi:mannose-1-phosphate guanylyltransferase/mannose-6-phosphate isomerase [Halomonas almeriensis]|uniref:mannose-1-phosphate guanylyltransferase/mannose-6-phosphate isomerase n=1 Tax=Halomonas almeriensis TaxID=308163 RepID=UPI0025B56F54|nr:mannose-1-phosphate guanylyltransferase/mannose-6-phosphate isomerase [Halomonas almeriensis]MDN3554262.1 mannose-1-phosphate guanylyltransferase/mannose-6-phosphate isomerase [Halomonas almeriensis]
MHVVIIAGGSGSRLWPISQKAHPKPFMRLDGATSLLQQTYRRGQVICGEDGMESVTTVTHRELFFRTEDEYQALAPQQPLHYLLEPCGRNTAPAICAAALELKQRYGEDAMLLVLPADHQVNDEPAFAEAVKHAAVAAADDQLVTFGIKPTRAETGFGYIEIREAVHQAGSPIQPALGFTEKPDPITAEHYLASGRYFWNSGMFCFTAATLLAELAQHAPALLEHTQAALDAARYSEGGKHSVAQLDPELFAALAGDSIDCALMEHSSKLAVVPCDIGWSDIGSWQAMAELTPADARGNRVQGDVEMEDTKDCYIHSHHALTATLGVQDLVIVDTPGALLVAHRDRSQDVKQLAERLASHDSQHQWHQGKVHRPWGTYTVLEEGHRFKIKRIEVKPGASLSLQMHHHRSEHWVVVSGTARVTNEDSDFLLRTNESTYIPVGFRHRLENPGLMPLVVIEVQSGDYLGEDDIHRLDDVSGSGLHCFT